MTEPRDLPCLFSAWSVKRILAGGKTQTRRLSDRLGSLKNAQPGDRLWVRETWAPCDILSRGYELDEPEDIAFRADHTAIAEMSSVATTLDTYGWNWDFIKWKPSIFMPRWASRIRLEVTAKREERLQSITEADITAEGIDAIDYSVDLPHVLQHEQREEWIKLWDSINGKRASWRGNPLVTVFTFEVLEVWK